MPNLINPFRFAGGGGTTELAITASSSFFTNSGATYTYSGLSIGVADASRRVIALGSFHATHAATPTITVGGVSATLVAVTSSSNNISHSFIALAAVPTGTTADVVITHGTASEMRGGSITLWRAIGYSDTATDSGSVNNGEVLSDTLTCSASGFLLAAAAGDDACTDISWNVDATEDHQYDGRDLIHSEASILSPSTSQYIEADITLGTNPRTSLACASFEPT